MENYDNTDDDVDMANRFDDDSEIPDDDTKYDELDEEEDQWHSYMWWAIFIKNFNLYYRSLMLFFFHVILVSVLIIVVESR